MNQNRSVGGNRRDKSAIHQIDDDWGETCLNYVTANPPNNRFLQFARATNAGTLSVTGSLAVPVLRLKRYCPPSGSQRHSVDPAE